MSQGPWQFPIDRCRELNTVLITLGRLSQLIPADEGRNRLRQWTNALCAKPLNF